MSKLKKNTPGADKPVKGSRMDPLIEKVGFILYVFFAVITGIMATTLALFAIGFLMAATHWCDRFAASVFIVIIIIIIMTSSSSSSLSISGYAIV